MGKHNDDYDPRFVRLCFDALRTSIRRKYDRMKFAVSGGNDK